VWPGLDEVDDPKQKDRPVAELEHVADVDGRGHVCDPEVVARPAVTANGYSDVDRGNRGIGKRPAASGLNGRVRDAG
jgi:hypothetical protein